MAATSSGGLLSQGQTASTTQSPYSGAGDLNNGGTVSGSPSTSPNGQIGAQVSTPTLPSLDSLKTTQPQTAQVLSTGSPLYQADASKVGMLTQAQASDVDSANLPTATASNATSQDASSVGAGPLAGITNGQIDPNDATNSASQIDAITNANSPYIQLAEQQGLLSAASRGLQNSSIASGASEAAAVAAAAPLATQNASEAASGKLQDAQLGTQANLQNAQLGTQVSEANAAAGTDVSKANAAAKQAGEMQNSQLDTQANEFNSSQDAAAKELDAQTATAVSQSNAALGGQTAQFNASQAQAATTANAAAQNSMTQQTMSLNEDINKQYLSGTQAQSLASIQGQYNQLIASNQSASSLYQTYFSSIGSIMANQNIAPDRLAVAIQAQQAMLASGLSVIDQLNGMNLDVTLPSTTASTAPGGLTTTTPATTPGVTTAPAAPAAPASPFLPISSPGGPYKLPGGSPPSPGYTWNTQTGQWVPPK